MSNIAAPSGPGSHLILGGTGFIGRHLALALAQSGARVIIASRHQPAFEFPVDVRRLITWKQLDVTSADWLPLLSEVESVHHYAWATLPATAQEDPTRDVTVNLVPLIRLLQALRELAPGSVTLTFASSGGTVYGKLSEIPVAETHELRPITVYGTTKVAAEEYLRLYQQVYGVDVRIARLSNPYGAGRTTSGLQGVIGAIVSRALRDETISIWGDGSVVRDFIHISDAVSGLLALSSASLSSLQFSEFNVGTGEGTSIKDVIQVLESILHRSVRVRYEPARAYDVPISILDITRAKHFLLWRPQVSINQGIARTVDAFKADSAFSS